jgi:lipopolysaccharide biosynthesis protein
MEDYEGEGRAVAPGAVILPGVMPSWDNTARRVLRAHVFCDSTPALFYEWLMRAIARAQKNRESERIVVINAWNEWAEGAYLEPDRNTGHARLAACAAAISGNLGTDSRVADLFKRSRQNFKDKHLKAVVIHLFYEDLAEWFSRKVSDFGDVDIYVTVEKTIDWETAQHVARTFDMAYILEVENRGRDIRPFLLIYPHFVNKKYEFVCKLHTKRSPHLSEGDRWREDIVDQLLSRAAKEALELNRAEPAVGILAARGSLETLEDPNIRVRSEKNLVALATSLNCQINYSDSFVVGSMFWFRPEIVRNLHKIIQSEFEFEPELGQIDGTLAHAIERIFCVAAKTAGMSTKEFGDAPINRPTRWA